MTDRFTILPHERTSPVWIALAKHLTERLSILRQRNDASLAQDQTENVRGRIAQIKEILALADDPPAS